MLRIDFMLHHLHNRREPIRVGRVVVVDVARRVDIPRIIRIATIRRAQPHVLHNLHPILSRIRLMPLSEHRSRVNDELRPISHFFTFQMKQPSRDIDQSYQLMTL